MADKLIIVRHGETEWSKSGQHTSYTDLPLTENGEAAAAALEPRLRSLGITKVFSSPRQRAMDTAAMALPDLTAEITDDLVEWNYGEYEGLTSATIRESDPKWLLWTDGNPGGESPDEVRARCERLITLSEQFDGTVAYFAHGHILRAFGLTWLDLPFSVGERFGLDTTSVSVLGYLKGERALLTWNS